MNLLAPPVSLLTGEVVHDEQGAICASMNKIIDELPQTIPTVDAISSKGCAVAKGHLHFDAAGYKELGKRNPAQMLLLGYNMSETK